MLIGDPQNPPDVPECCGGNPACDAYDYCSSRLLKGDPMSASTTLAGLMPLVQSAAGVIAAFRGDAAAASTDAKIADAVEILQAGADLATAFSRGEEVTPENVRNALAGMDDAIADFDAEIAKQSNP